MKIVFDIDGTIAIDFGKNYDQDIIPSPCFSLMKAVIVPEGGNEVFIVTGRTFLPLSLEPYFDRKHTVCRDWEITPALRGSGYYAKYFEWKIAKIVNIYPDLCIDDDQQICRYLNNIGIQTIWTPACHFNGIAIKEVGHE